MTGNGGGGVTTTVRLKDETSPSHGQPAKKKTRVKLRANREQAGSCLLVNQLNGKLGFNLNSTKTAF